MQVAELQRKVTTITSDMKMEAESIAVNILGKVFTPGQIKVLMSTKNRIKWSSEDIMSAISLRPVSPKAYRYLRNVKNIPLPCDSTLRNWVTEFKTSPGILKSVFDIMSSKGSNLPNTAKLTVLTFDELYISNQINIEPKE